MKKITYTSLILIMIWGSSCSTTSITGSYKAPGVSQVAYKKVFLSALTENTSVKQTIETKLAAFLNSKGISTVRSSDVFPPNFHSSGNDKDKEVILQKVRDNGCDGILTIALLKQETETRYVQGSTYPVSGFGYYGTFGAYYNYGYSSFYSPGYYTNDKKYYVETNLYDTQSEKLVWSAQSETYDPSSMDSFMKGYEKALSKQVVKDGLVGPGSE